MKAKYIGGNQLREITDNSIVGPFIMNIVGEHNFEEGGIYLEGKDYQVLESLPPKAKAIRLNDKDKLEFINQYPHKAKTMDQQPVFKLNEQSGMLEEQPRMKEPSTEPETHEYSYYEKKIYHSCHPFSGPDEEYNHDWRLHDEWEEYVTKYNDHIASLRKLTILPEHKEHFKAGVEYVEGKNFEAGYTCPDCGGDGKETCNNPDHGFMGAVGGEISRLGCPVCGHDPDHKVNRGKNKCEYCKGTGAMTDSEIQSYANEINESIDGQPVAIPTTAQGHTKVLEVGSCPKHGGTSSINNCELCKLEKDISSLPTTEPEQDTYMDQLMKSRGRTPEYTYTGPVCHKECKNYSHYETKHHSECPRYKGSLSEKHDTELQQLREENERLKKELNRCYKSIDQLKEDLKDSADAADIMAKYDMQKLQQENEQLKSSPDARRVAVDIDKVYDKWRELDWDENTGDAFKNYLKQNYVLFHPSTGDKNDQS